MNWRKALIFLSLYGSLHSGISAQVEEQTPSDSLRFSGQLSGWAQYAPDIQPEGWLGVRYIPQLNFEFPFNKSSQFDFEVSANIYGEAGFSPFDSLYSNGKIKPYRAWVRYSGSRMELRAGLQKINFGSALLFRPLMWFDSLNPRDPLQLTDGVWGLLFRYYFQNNTNLWFWSLYGNKNSKGLEVSRTHWRTPEVGGRIQLPVPRGEAAVSYHYRKADVTRPGGELPIQQNGIGENRIGLDIRLDVTVGLWAEASWTHLNKNMGVFTNQEMLTVGTDYTFAIGNGLSLTFEQFIYTSDQKAFAMDNTLSLSGLSLSYPLTLFDNLRTVVYYDWNNTEGYYFADWQRQLNHFTFHVMAYWNPDKVQMITQSLSSNRFAGKGIQLLVVWNH
ncbi:MAG TPA: hypothetical protein PKA78_10290 [Macellibacteroides fermentans]|jgi:hypothetical protein|uniref:hypothetical protein n=1 Tax=Macellibacteroides fermentans TaxID=879969 RepID=UPI002BEDFFFD|nr:hypothetical protein [Macellibacteroides fermentans]